MKHILGFSGGIDSQACARWLLNRYPVEDVILLNSQAGRNESLVTVKFVKNYSVTVHHVEEVIPIVADLWADGSDRPEAYGLDPNAELTFTEMCRIKKRAPSRTRQFCTQFLKLIPSRRWIRKHFGPTGEYSGQDYERYAGVRRDESQSRTNALEREWDEYFDCWLNRPLVAWTKKQCFDFVLESGESFNPLYLLGFNRVGCAPCINSGKEDVLLWHQRFPERIEAIRERERISGVTYFAPCVPGMTMNFVDDVVKWAHTDRGGRQPNMFKILNERPSCESKYGLCE